MSKHSVDVVQIGAREHYAVPLMMDRLGLLRYFHTDVYAGRGSAIGPLARAAGRVVHSHSFRKLLERQADISAEKIRANNLIGFREMAQLRKAKSVLETTRIFHRFQNRIAEAAFARATPPPDVFIGFRGSDRLFELARPHSCCILDQIDGALLEVEIIKKEQQKFCDWLPQTGKSATKQAGLPSWLELETPRLQKEWGLADAIVCNSVWTRQCVTNSGVSAEKCIVVPLAYEPAVEICLDPQPPHPPNSLTVAFVGSLTLRKGVHILLEAARIASAAVDIKVILAGTLDIRMEKLARYSGVAEYLGLLPRGRIPTLFRRSDILALPSISEGFGIVQLEAMSHGLPVIASDRTGNVVRDGIDGRVIPAGDVESLAHAFVELASNPEGLQQMRLAAVERSKQFSLQVISDKWHEAVQFGLDKCARRK